MPRLNASIRVEAPVDLVFRIVEAPPGPLLPSGGPRLVRRGTELGIGAAYRWEFQRLGFHFRTDSVVTAYEPPHRIVFQGTAGWETEAEVLCEAEEDGATRMTFRMKYRFPPPLRWIIPGPLIRLGIWHAIRQVKAMAEAAASAVGPTPVAEGNVSL